MNGLKFEGKGFDFFKINFVNVILSFLSLSLLYPRVKVLELKYVCSKISLNNQPFTFTGTIGWLFKGYIKTALALLFIILLAGAGGVLAAVYKDNFILYSLLYSLAVITCTLLLYLLTPMILHGSLNYRFDNTTWGDIKPSYHGKISELVNICFIGYILTTLTCGIYEAWYQVKLFKYILQNIKFGSLRFDFSGDAKALFLIYLKGSLLTVLTFGIYGIWFAKKIYEYRVNNIVVKKDDQEFNLHSDANTLEVFEMMVGNFLLILLTLGIGTSWAYMRFLKFIINHCVIPGDFNFSSIGEPQEEEEEAKESNQNWLDKWNPQFMI